ncbi:MAG: DUF4402 domain-containing protein [Ferruginibacter sp.]
MKKSRLIKAILAVWFVMAAPGAFGQFLPGKRDSLQEAFKVNIIQPLQFGFFAQGKSGGTVNIAADGSRTASGTVIPLNFGLSYSQMILEIEAPAGTIVSVLGSTSRLTGTNGGTMLITIGNSNPVSPFNIVDGSPSKTYLNIGAVLTVGNAAESPAGNYDGNVYISFMFE